MNKHLQNQLARHPGSIQLPKPPLPDNGTFSPLVIGAGHWYRYHLKGHQQNRFEANKKIADIEEELKPLYKQREKLQAQHAKICGELAARAEKIANSEDPLVESQLTALKTIQKGDLEAAAGFNEARIQALENQTIDLAAIIYDEEYLRCYRAVEQSKIAIAHYQEFMDKAAGRLAEKDAELKGKFTSEPVKAVHKPLPEELDELEDE